MGGLIDLAEHKQQMEEEAGAVQALNHFIAVLTKKLGGRVVVTKDDIEDILENPHDYTMEPHPTVKEAYVIVCRPLSEGEAVDGEPAGDSNVH